MKRTKQLIMSFVAIAVLGVGASARAQDSTTPPPSEPPPAAHSSSSNSISLGGGAGIGIGATVTLSGLGAFGPAAQFVYDAVDLPHRGPARLQQPSRSPAAIAHSDYVFGVGGWYHLHRGSSSDFSVGGADLASTRPPDPGGVADRHRRSSRARRSGRSSRRTSPCSRARRARLPLWRYPETARTSASAGSRPARSASRTSSGKNRFS